ncbi:MAG TPA: ARMT1-like domain-containing protein [Elusimicrobiales bacterium]|nr:ARMT1-like domain-containing protein [Elusimicrobiales bacterium]
MKTSLDCIPCLFRQALDSARMFSRDPAVHEAILREVLDWCTGMDMSKPAPVMGQRIHRRLRRITGARDPYRKAKAAQNRLALRLLPELRSALASSEDRLGLAIRVAIAGNIIDMGAAGDVSLPGVRKSLMQALGGEVTGDCAAFRPALKKARSILYLADNAGEIVFDRLLIEELGPSRVTLAVRGSAVLNDALRADARAAGLHRLVRIVDNGSDAPGTLLAEAPPAFKSLFMKADLVLAKGQGNYETLSEAPRPVWFLFKAKCPVIAERAGVRLGAQVVARSKVRSADR